MALGRLILEKEIREAEICNPALGFAAETQSIEYRRDPLTGARCRINAKRANRVKEVASKGAGIEDLPRIPKEGCAFCPENVERMTPKFPDELIKGGRLKVGSAIVFPNLYPFSKYHGVAVFSEAHDAGLGEISPEGIRDCVRACVEFLSIIGERDPRAIYGSINWNYMPPAGASIVHPHLQVIADAIPTRFQEELIRCSESYYGSHGSSYWVDLIETERALGERMIREGPSVVWLASYAPRGNNEVLGILPGASSISGIDDAVLMELSDGLTRILRGYRDLGARSFNMSIVPGPLDRELEYYALNVRILSRPNPGSHYTSDCGFMERIHLESVVESMPEAVAERLRRYFA
jgi:galactose-1-phosphate uridylyltransferase